jgi:hypothetical protein
MKTDTEQKSVQVPQRKRMAMGEKLNGQSMKGSTAPTKQAGGLSQAKKK